MPNILHKRNSTADAAPTTSSLALGELAINTADGKLFLHKSSSAGESIQSALITDSSNTGIIILTGSLILKSSSSINSGTVLSLSSSLVEFDFDTLAFSGSASITGSLGVIGGITGSLFGTASYATQALSASFAPSTPAFPFTGSAIITGSLNVIGNTTMTGSLTATGLVGIGVTTPTAVLHLKAGTAAASTAPLKLTSGTNLTTPEAGAVEFDGSNLFFTPASTRQIVVAAQQALTSSRIPIVTTGGRLTDSSALTFSGTSLQFYPGSDSATYFEFFGFNGNSRGAFKVFAPAAGLGMGFFSLNEIPLYFGSDSMTWATIKYGKLYLGGPVLPTAYLHIASGSATAGTAPIKLIAGTNLTTPEAGTIEFNGTNLFFTTGSTRSTILTNTNPASITGNLVVTGSLLVSGSVRLNGNAGVNITGNTQITGSLLLSGSSLVAGYNPTPLEGTIQDGVTSVLGNLNDWNSDYYQGTVLYKETAGGTIGFGQLCYRTMFKTWELADATVASETSFNMLGICVRHSVSGSATSILINGFIETTYATIGKSGEPLYMDTTSGSMNATPPTSVGNVVRLIGNTFWTSNANTKIIIHFNPDRSWIEL